MDIAIKLKIVEGNQNFKNNDELNNLENFAVAELMSNRQREINSALADSNKYINKPTNVLN